MTTTVPDLPALRGVATITAKGHETETRSADTVNIGEGGKRQLATQCKAAGFFLETESVSSRRGLICERWSRENWRVDDDAIRVTLEWVDIPITDNRRARYTVTVEALRLMLDPQQCRDLLDGLNVLEVPRGALPFPLADLHRRLTGDA